MYNLSKGGDRKQRYEAGRITTREDDDGGNKNDGTAAQFPPTADVGSVAHDDFATEVSISQPPTTSTGDDLKAMKYRAADPSKATKGSSDGHRGTDDIIKRRVDGGFATELPMSQPPPTSHGGDDLRTTKLRAADPSNKNDGHHSTDDITKRRVDGGFATELPMSQPPTNHGGDGLRTSKFRAADPSDAGGRRPGADADDIVMKKGFVQGRRTGNKHDMYAQKFAGRQTRDAATRVGAHRVSGNDVENPANDDDFTILYNDATMPDVHEGTDVSPVALTTTASAGLQSVPAPVLATTVPELVTAQATPADEIVATFYCCGLRCGSIMPPGATETEKKQIRRKLYAGVGFALLVLTVLVAGLSIGLANGGSDSPLVFATPSPSASSAPSGSRTEPPSTSPTRMPTTSPTAPPSPLETERFFTTLNYTHYYYGHMFDIRALRDISVVSMSIHCRSTQLETFELWTKEDGYVGYETDAFRWAKINAVDVVGQGTGSLTPLPRSLFNNGIRVRAGAKQSFYIVSPSLNIYFQERFVNGTSVINYGDLVYSNEDMEINVGTGVQYTFQDKGPPNVFNGEIEYVIE